MKYTIEETTLTAIGNALRSKYGDKKIVTETQQNVISAVSKTSNLGTGISDRNGFYLKDLNSDYYKMEVIHIPNASSIKVNLNYYLFVNQYSSSIGDYLYIAPGAYNTPSEWNAAGHSGATGYTSSGSKELVFSNTEYLTFYLKFDTNAGISTTNRSLPGYYAKCVGLDADGNTLPETTEVEVEVVNTYSPLDMAEAINNITVGGEDNGDCNGLHVPEKRLVISDSCPYRFTRGWEWFIEEFGEHITTEKINNGQYMFTQSYVMEIPFDINFTTVDSATVNGNNDVSHMFYLSRIEKAPYLTGSIAKTQNMFKSCGYLKEIPDDWADKIDFHNIREYTYANASHMFDGCYSLRSIPDGLLEALNTSSTSSNSGSRTYYKGLASGCAVLEELVLPVQQMIMTDESLSYTADNCYRLNKFVFKTQEDGTPYTVSWNKQVLSLHSNTGFGGTESYIINYKSGITKDKIVKDDATYAALKNDPDWYTLKADYSRYNKTSAVETINSLPDTSAYLASLSGTNNTNTIKFKGTAGRYTDGGAINTLTEEEIAVATAKGWTVSFV